MLVFLPGLICDARTFEAQAKAFPESLVVDSYGDVDSLTKMAQIALQQADSRGVEQIDVFGHSMGGRVALEVFRLAPKRVRRIALVSTGVHPLGKNEPAKRAALQQVGHDNGFEALVDQWLPPMVADANRARADLYDPMREMCLSAGQERFDAQIAALVGRSEVDSLLPQISCPALVMTGELDQWAPPEQHEGIADRLVDSRLVIIPGAGHMLPLEAPAEVNQAVADWLMMPADDEV